MGRGKRFCCLFCGSGVASEIAHSNHIRIHTKEKPFACTSCDKSFHYKSRLRLHMRSHDEERKFKCDKCPKTFKVSSYFHAHRESFHSGKEFKCSSCELTFRSKGKLNYHIALRHSSYSTRRFGCDVCEMRFVFKNEYLHHIRTHTNERPFKCDKCGKAFHTEYNLRVHKLIHEPHQFHCESCAKTFATKSLAQQHVLRMHTKLTGERCHCPICKREFRLQMDLTRHLPIHSEQRDFQCSTCFVKFKSQLSLSGHNKRMHGAAMIYKCPLCPKTTKYKDYLKRHIARHAADACKIQCVFCSYQTHQKANLMIHIRGHTKEKPHFCELCEFSTTAQTKLDDHFRFHHTLERPFKCESKCDKVYASFANLQRHYKVSKLCRLG